MEKCSGQGFGTDNRGIATEYRTYQDPLHAKSAVILCGKSTESHDCRRQWLEVFFLQGADRNPPLNYL